LLELAAQAGKAVFSEKPIALDLAETTRVVNIIAERGIPVQLGFMRRFDPGYARAKQKIEAGELGRIELFRALSRDTYPPSLEFLLGSGGIFLDMAVHDFDLARFLVGEVEEVQAWGAVLVDERFAVEAPQKTPLLFAKDFSSSFDHLKISPTALQRLIDCFRPSLRHYSKESSPHRFRRMLWKLFGWLWRPLRVGEKAVQ